MVSPARHDVTITIDVIDTQLPNRVRVTLQGYLHTVEPLFSLLAQGSTLIVTGKDGTTTRYGDWSHMEHRIAIVDDGMYGSTVVAHAAIL